MPNNNLIQPIDIRQPEMAQNSLLAGDSEQLQKIAQKIFYNFNIDVEYSGDFEAFYKEYFL